MISEMFCFIGTLNKIITESMRFSFEQVYKERYSPLYFYRSFIKLDMTDEYQTVLLHDI